MYHVGFSIKGDGEGDVDSEDGGEDDGDGEDGGENGDDNGGKDGTHTSLFTNPICFGYQIWFSNSIMPMKHTSFWL